MNRDKHLMTTRQIQQEYGFSEHTAKTFTRMMARAGESVRIDGLRRVFFRREDVERRIDR